MKLSSLLLLLSVTCATGYQQPQPPTTTSNRRDLFRSVAGATVAFVGGGSILTTTANAIDVCPKGSNNCIRTTWTPPSGTSKKDAAQQIKAVLDSYPQEGQEKVDLGGWAFASDNLASSGTASLEYKVRSFVSALF